MPAIARHRIEYVPTADLKPDPRNPRVHSRAQIQALAETIKAVGFNVPLTVDEHLNIVTGHGRLEAARLVGLEDVPVIRLCNLTKAQLRAFMLADNKLNERSAWDAELLSGHLTELSKIDLGFEITATGFETAEIDYYLQLGEDELEGDRADTFALSAGPAVSRIGDVWQLGRHRVVCGDALDSLAYSALMEGDKATAVVTDPPYNVKVDGNISGLGKVHHREFAMASGEMSVPQFTDFLAATFANLKAHISSGALLYVFMDWRHLRETLAAGDASEFEQLNLCVWNKSNGGMGSLYRSKHELVFVFKSGNAPHKNNVQLGRYGRNRSNVWNYPGANVFSGAGKKRAVELHPTVKPARMVADIISDCTDRSNIVLDPFLGSGTTLLAAERTDRCARGMELDPIYVDTAIRRWQEMTGDRAIHGSGKSFQNLAIERA